MIWPVPAGSGLQSVRAIRFLGVGGQTMTTPDETPDGRDEQPRRDDPDAPGNYVDDEEQDAVPEPNEPA
jgi:hypothetical protein